MCTFSYFYVKKTIIHLICLFIYWYIHMLRQITHMNIYGKGTIQKHAEVLLILQEWFKAESPSAGKILFACFCFPLWFLPSHTVWWWHHDKLSPSSDNFYIVIKLLVVNMKDVEPHYVRKGIKFLHLSLNSITVVALGFNVL